MNIRERVVNEAKNRLELFEYYKSIGCTDNQSLVLSLYTYGCNRYNYRGIEAFCFYYRSYKNHNNREMSFCDYIVDKILSVQEKNVYLGDALGYAKEYIEFVEERRKNNPPTLDSFNEGYSNKSNKRGFGGVVTRSAVNNTFAGVSVKKAKSISNSVDNSMSFVCMSTSIDACDEGFFDAECSSNVVLSAPMKESSILNQVSEVVIKDFMEKIATDSYETIEEKGFLSPLTSPTSTFRMTSNTVAFGILRKNKNSLRKFDKSMVRIEELLNNFEYKLSKPTTRMFNINTQICDKPNSKNKLLFVGLIIFLTGLFR